MKTEIRVLIADDHPIFRHGLKQVIEEAPHLKVVAEASDGIAAFEQIQQTRPDVAILDIDMPGEDGFAVARKIREHRLPAIVIFLTMHKDELHFNEALDLGVRGYIVKDNAAADVVNCINAVAAGQDYISPSLSTHLLNRTRRATALAKHQPGLADLTAAERRILALLAEYKTSREIASELCVSVRTVENHRANICAKLELHGSHALVKFAIQHKSELFRYRLAQPACLNFNLFLAEVAEIHDTAVKYPVAGGSISIRYNVHGCRTSAF
jgi:DNA-binding NarL/FixJ family response regulator